MRKTGIAFMVLGALSVFACLFGTMVKGDKPNFTGITFVVLGAFLVSRADKKTKELEKKEQWEQNDKLE